MKLMIKITKIIIMPIMAFLFVGLLILSAFASGYMEFHVLQQWLTLPSSPHNAYIWSLILVFCLEGLKLSLHLYIHAFKTAKTNNKEIPEAGKTFRAFLSAVKNLLIIFSFFCSIIYTSNIFFNDVSSAQQDIIDKNHQKCDTALQNGQNNLYNNINASAQKRLQRMQNEIDLLNERITNYDTIISNEAYSKKRDELRKDRDALETKKAQLLSSLDTTFEKYKNEELKKHKADFDALEAKYGSSGTERIDFSNEEAMNVGDNPYLRTFLLSIYKTFGNKSYSRVVYWMCTIIISTLISAFLECCIHFSEVILNLEYSSFESLFNQNEIPIEASDKFAIRLVSWALFSIASSMGIYILLSYLMEINVTKRYILLATLCYGISTFVINALMVPTPSHNNPPTVPESSFLQRAISAFKADLPGCIAGMVISSVLFFIIGFFTNGNSSYDSLAAIAIAFGGCVSRLVSFEKFNLGRTA